MNEDRFITLRIKSAEEMSNFGNAFSCFLAPLIYSSAAAPQAPVVSLYGPRRCGKSTFSDGVFAPFNKTGLDLSWGMNKKIGDYVFRHDDHGACFDWQVAPSSPLNLIALFDRLFSKYRATTTGKIKLRSAIKEPGFDLFEHALMPHFRLSSAVILFGRWDILDYTLHYFNKMESEFKNYANEGCVRHAKGKTGTKQSQDSTTSMVLAQIKAIRELMTRLPDGTKEQNNERIVTIGLAVQNPATLQGFAHLRQQTSRFSYLNTPRFTPDR